MQSITTLNLNLQYPNYATTMHAVQNDRLSRKIEAHLFDGTTAWNPPTGTYGVVRFTKPDGTKGFYDVDEAGNTAVTWSENIATIMLAEQVLTVPGKVYCQVNFYNASEERLSAFAFCIQVQKCAIDDDTIISTDYFNILTEQIARIIEGLENVPSPSTSAPLMDGTAAVGTQQTYARGDHRHPTDTSRAAVSVTVTDVTYASATHTISRTKNGTSAQVVKLGSIVDLEIQEVTT